MARFARTHLPHQITLHYMTGMLVDLHTTAIVVWISMYVGYGHLNSEWCSGVPMLLSAMVFYMSLATVCERILQ